MAQSSGPIAQGTDAERQFTDVLWRDLFGDEGGVVGDRDGSAYKVTLAPDSDVAQIGSTTQDSVARLAGFAHRIAAGQPEPITIPAASGVARTDVIALRYDPANTGAPGPVRLTRVAGTTSAVPFYDDAPPGIEYLPLWAVTRTPGQALSQATVRQLFTRMAPTLTLPAGATLPPNSPLGTRLRVGTTEYIRQLGGGNVAAWVNTAPASTATGWTTPTLAGFSHRAGQSVQYMRDAEGFVHLRGSMANTNTFSAPSNAAFRLPVGFRPAIPFTVPIATNTSPFNANVSVNTTGDVVVSAFVGSTPAGRAFYLNIPPFDAA